MAGEMVKRFNLGVCKESFRLFFFLISFFSAVRNVSAVDTEKTLKIETREGIWRELLDYKNKGIVYELDSEPDEQERRDIAEYNRLLMEAKEVIKFSKALPEGAWYEDIYGRGDTVSQIKIFICKSDENFYSFRNTRVPVWVGGLTVYNKHALVYKASTIKKIISDHKNANWQTKSLAHEIYHILMGDYINSNKNFNIKEPVLLQYIPKWIIEGMAVCATQNGEMNNLIDEIIKKFSFPKLDNLRHSGSIFKVDKGYMRSNIGYLVSYRFTAYLVSYLDGWLERHPDFEFKDNIYIYNGRPQNGYHMLLMIMARVTDGIDHNTFITFEDMLYKSTKESESVCIRDLEGQWRKEVFAMVRSSVYYKLNQAFNNALKGILNTIKSITRFFSNDT